MSKIILDDDLRGKLNGLQEMVEVCDTSGKIVGQFVPQEEYVRMVYAWAKAEVTDEELDKSRNEPGGSTLAQIWQRLGVQ